jgi:hypothetical protein
MIVWQGWGFLAALIPMGGYLLLAKIVQVLLGAAYLETHSWPGALGTLIGAAVVWVLGWKLNGPGRTLVDPVTGKNVVLRKRNTLFFVPMQYVGIVLGVVALGMFFLKHDSTL